MVDQRIAQEIDHMEDVLHMVQVDSCDQPAIRTCGVQAIGGT